MKKLTTLSILLISLVFVVPMQASAATNAGVKPGSFFYFFDTASENISLFFTFNPEQKAKKALEYADERLAEIEAIAEEKNPGAVKTAIANYESNVALATEKSKEVKDKGQAENLLNLIADNNSKNQEVLATVLIKVPEEAKEAITQAIEASRKGQEEATKQIAELKGEIEKLKNEVAELKAKETKVETNAQENEVEKLKKEVETLKKQSATQSAPKQSAPTISVSELETQRQKSEAEQLKLQVEQLQRDSQTQKLQAQQLQDQQQRDAIAKRQNCLNTHPTKAQIQQATDAAIATLNSSMTASKASISSQYDREIAALKRDRAAELNSYSGNTGFAYNTAAIRQFNESTEESIKDLEMRKQELLSMADAGYGTKIADVRMRALQMLQESSEMVCGI